MKKYTGITHFFCAAKYSFDGFRAMLGEAAFRQELLAGVVAIPAAWLLPELTLLWRVLLTVAWIGLVTAEILNTAIEAVVDMVMPERHPLAKKAKDLGSAAVFCACTVNVLCWAAALWLVFFGAA